MITRKVRYLNLESDTVAESSEIFGAQRPAPKEDEPPEEKPKEDDK